MRVINIVLDSRFADTHLLLLCASPLMLYEIYIREHVLYVPFRKTGHQFGRACNKIHSIAVADTLQYPTDMSCEEA